MKNYIEYDLGDGAKILIEMPDESTSGIVKVAHGDGEIAVTKANKSFRDALKDVKAQAKLLLNEIEELHVNEAEVKFGINTVGELGNMAIGKIGVGVNYEITLKWKKPDAKLTSKSSK
ncbi:MAG: hypothetical protein CL609_22875 [Anaerolineaceae bacterium]|nr:hypothetical protein [Anaerolineaceae bacterium]